jgi:ribA/ribD-fused uncharacterized protein
MIALRWDAVCVRRFPFLLLILLSGCAAQPARLAAPPTAPARIDSFQGDYRFLSNFYPATVVYQGITYPDSEHAYQSAKTLDMNARRRIAAIPTPAAAKRAGEALVYRADWAKVKYQVMLDCVRDKFARNPDLRAKLLATGDAYLEEGNTWGDQIWGVYQGRGTNWLGKVLMQVRKELRE